jgi:hypothetical protein
VIQQVFGDTVSADRATIDVRRSTGAAGWFIDVVPANPSACPISVLADSPPQIDLFIGSEPIRASLELWEDDRERNLSRLREMVRAIAEGRYEQRVVTASPCEAATRRSQSTRLRRASPSGSARSERTIHR